MTTAARTSVRARLARHKAGLVLLVLVALLLAALGASALYLNQQIGSITRLDIDLHPHTGSGLGALGDSEEASGEPSVGDGRAVNILLAGVDAGESSRIADAIERGTWVPGSHRTDAIMVLHLTADRQHAYLISVPRDTWVPIDGYGMAKINAAFSYGGPSLFVRTLEQFTGLRMDHLAIADWQGFEDLTNALGGVTLQQKNGRPLTLDGQAALDYVRERYSLPRGDLDRMQRQQNVIRALSDRIMTARTLADPLRLTRLLRAVTDNIVVDRSLTTATMRSLALSLGRLGTGGVLNVSLPVERFDRISGQSVVIIDRGRTRAIFGAVMTDDLDEYLSTHQVDTLPEAADVP